jgi:hypothetical protein
MKRLLVVLIGCLLCLSLRPQVIFAQEPAATRMTSVLPSTLLPPNTTELDFAIRTPDATECRYALENPHPFEGMMPFASTGGTDHQTRLMHLSPDPNRVNLVHVRCAAYAGEVLTVKYRSLSESNPRFPRTGNLWGSWELLANGRSVEHLAKIDLWLGAGDFDPELIRQIRSLNPDARFLHSINAIELNPTWLEEPVPDNYFLLDVNGNRVEVWPGAYRVNITKPEVQQYMARMAYDLIVDNDLMFDGMFFDNVMLTQSWQTADIYGTPFPVDSNEDGVQDNPATFDAAWRAGLLNELRIFRQLMPHAVINGHAMDINDPEVAAIFNATSIGFDAVNVIERKVSWTGSPMMFSDFWNRYASWQTLAVPPVGTMVESAVFNQIGYGYGFLPYDVMPRSTWNFARDYYPYMRFGLAATLMHDGFFAHEIGDTYHGNDWWYDELDHDLGYPLGPAQFLTVSAGTPVDVVTNNSFEQNLDNWNLWDTPEEGYDAEITLDTNNPAEGAASARIDIAATAGENWRILFSQTNRTVEANVVYDVRFWARADRLRMITVNTQKDAPDWRGYGLWVDQALTTEWREYRLSFMAPENASDARLGFNLGVAPGTVWIDNVRITPSAGDVLRRDFENGVALLNATTQPQTIQVGPGFRRLTGAQAPRYQYIVDDIDSGFTTQGNWQPVQLDSGEWKAVGPYYHDWGIGAHLGTGTAQWNLNIPAADTYSLSVWWPAAPEAGSWSSAARFEVLSAQGAVVASASFDQRTGGDEWHSIGSVGLEPGATVRLVCEGSGPCLADAFHLQSQARYNDGSLAEVVTLAPMDGIVLARAQ